jgi:1-phosphofructokinase
MMRVHTLTLNPAIDQTITLDALVPGQVHRARGVRQNAGGKGINVASCLADWGVPVSAHGLLGRDNAAPFEALFAAKPITDAMVRVDGATRVNLKLVDAHDTTDINLDGLAVTDETLATVLDGLAASAAPGDMVVLAGSLPGCPPDCYATLVARLRGQGRMCCSMPAAIR